MPSSVQRTRQLPFLNNLVSLDSEASEHLQHGGFAGLGEHGAGDISRLL